MRTGLLRFGREDVEDAAAHRVFAHHFDRLAPLVADALQVRDHIFERQFVAFAQAEGKLAIEIRRLDLAAAPRRPAGS